MCEGSRNIQAELGANAGLRVDVQDGWGGGGEVVGLVELGESVHADCCERVETVALGDTD